MNVLTSMAQHLHQFIHKHKKIFAIVTTVVQWYWVGLNDIDNESSQTYYIDGTEVQVLLFFVELGHLSIALIGGQYAMKSLHLENIQIIIARYHFKDLML